MRAGRRHAAALTFETRTNPWIAEATMPQSEREAETEDRHPLVSCAIGVSIDRSDRRRRVPAYCLRAGCSQTREELADSCRIDADIASAHA